jgi:hypothetical protein
LVLLCGVTALAAGCGGDDPELAPVSGVVKVDGKPYPNAYVTFQPVGSEGNPNPGRGSTGTTDAEGRFTLRYDGGQDGAVVGKHIVRITSMQPADDPSRFKGTETGSTDGDDPTGAAAALAARGLKPEIIPKEWHTDSRKEFVVPAGGTDQANFDIVSLRGKAKK